MAVVNLFSRLAVKSLLRSRCVYKSSRSLISDPYFVKLNLNRSIFSKNCQKIFCGSFPPQSIDYKSLLDKKKNKNNNNNKNNAVVELDCPLWSRNRRVSVIGSCNGLICYVVDRINVILYNPYTRVSKELPQPPNIPPLYKTYYHGYYYGFAFDSSDEDDYKVVLGTKILNEDTSKSFIFHIFSLRHNSWRRTQHLSCYYGSFDVCGNGIFVSGAFHWLLKPSRGYERLHLDRVIISFDLSKEVFSEMSLDNIIHGATDFFVYELGAFEECLYVLNFAYSPDEQPVEVWLMEEYGVNPSWTKFITIPCSKDTNGLELLCFLRNGKLLLQIHEYKSEESNAVQETKLVLYTINEWGFTEICKCPFEAVVYVESLVSPNGFDGDDKHLQVPPAQEQ